MKRWVVRAYERSTHFGIVMFVHHRTSKKCTKKRNKRKVAGIRLIFFCHWAATFLMTSRVFQQMYKPQAPWPPTTSNPRWKFAFNQLEQVSDTRAVEDWGGCGTPLRFQSLLKDSWIVVVLKREREREGERARERERETEKNKSYLHESWAKGPWKGFPLRKPLGMQLTVSAKVFLKWRKIFFFWLKFWRKFMYTCLNCIVDICT